MRRSFQRTLLAAAASGLLAGPAAAGPADAFPAAQELRGGWEVVDEAPGNPAADPDLVAWGVREQQVRHFTRDHRRRIEVCSVEIWSFASEAQARAAENGFRYPTWQIRRAGPWLVMVRGLVLPPDGVARRGVFPSCESIGSGILDRAARMQAGGNP